MSGKREDGFLPENVRSIISSYGIREVHICGSEEESWDTIWRWLWFMGEMWIAQCWKKTEKSLQPLFPLLHSLNVTSILDSSCGLGLNTVMFARRNYEVEGSD